MNVSAAQLSVCPDVFSVFFPLLLHCICFSAVHLSSIRSIIELYLERRMVLSSDDARVRE